MCVTFTVQVAAVNAQAAQQHCVPAELPVHEWMLSNVRGLQQASGELMQILHVRKPHFFLGVECHLDGNPLKPLIPSGYKSVRRLDRTKHGGGLIFLARKYMLVDTFDVSKYNTIKAAEMIGVEFDGITYIGFYTSDSSLAPVLFKALTRIKADFPQKTFVFMGDANAHNPDWIPSISPLDEAGSVAEEFAVVHGLKQLELLTSPPEEVIHWI